MATKQVIYPVFASKEGLLSDIAKNDEAQKKPRRIGDPNRYTNHQTFRNVRLLTKDDIYFEVYFRDKMAGVVTKLQTRETYFWYVHPGQQQKGESHSVHHATTRLCAHINRQRNTP